MPEQLQNVVVLDASFPTRKLVHYDKTIQNAETLPDCVKMGVKFQDNGRTSMEKGFKGDRGRRVTQFGGTLVGQVGSKSHCGVLIPVTRKFSASRTNMDCTASFSRSVRLWIFKMSSLTLMYSRMSWRYMDI